MTASVTTRTMPYTDQHRFNANETPTTFAAMQSAFRAPPPAQSSASIISAPVSDNNVNRRGGTESSLYQSCLALRRRLAEVPGFEQHLAEMDMLDQEHPDDSDPVTSMWNMLRQGLPLLTLYNVLQPDQPITVDMKKFEGREEKAQKQATFQFLSACMAKLKFPAGECFLVTDLYNSDTNGLVKVLRVVNRVLDILAKNGLLVNTPEQFSGVDSVGPKKRNHQENVIEELVSTERDYVRHLDMLAQFKGHVVQSGFFSGDVIYDIFLNLDTLLEQQRRFLIRVEQQKALEASNQNWGMLFRQYQEAFLVYEPFIANQIKCNETVLNEWDKLRAVAVGPDCEGMLSAHTVLTGYLLKPFQRLSKYPLLLDELRKKTDYSPEMLHDLEEGAKAMKDVLNRANAAIERIKKNQEVQDLLVRVDDWKGHRIEQFGDLVTFGTHAVLKGDSGKDEREYKIYLFERILLCCKELNPNKPKTKLGNKTTDKKGRPKLQLKGRIFMQNVTDITKFSKNGFYFLQIFWKGDPGVENFVIKFLNQEVRDKWYSMVENQRRLFPKTSKTTFHYMAKANLPNPYVGQQEEDVDDDPPPQYTALSSNTTLVNVPSEPTSRVPSNSSLRSRSTTGGGTPGTARNMQTFPGMDSEQFYPPPLKVSTSIQSARTPDERMGPSYFSPTDSPSSLRSQGGSAFPFPHPAQGWPPSDGNKHATAPPMGRPQMSENHPNGHHHPGRGGLHRPPMSTMAQHRLRSMSSPDVHPANKRHPNVSTPVDSEVPVPPIPPQLAQIRAPVNRSESNSPTDLYRAAYGGGPPPHHHHPQALANARANQQYMAYNPGHVRVEPPHPQQSITPVPTSASSLNQRVMSPPLAQQQQQQQSARPPGPAAHHQRLQEEQQEDIPYPSQLKVKIHYQPEPSYVTLVVPIIIKHRSLIDRIDSKMEKAGGPCSIAKNTARLRYYDMEGDVITITNDEDVVLAIEEWGVANAHHLREGNIPDFDLYWHEVDNNNVPKPARSTAAGGSMAGLV